MVGKKIAVFTAVEVKLDKHGKYQATKEQKQFINLRKEIIKNIRDFKLNLYDVCEYDTKYRNIMITFIN